MAYAQVVDPGLSPNNSVLETKLTRLKPGQVAQQTSIQVARSSNLALSQVGWLCHHLPADPLYYFHLWCEKSETWLFVRLDSAFVRIEDTTTMLLMRLPRVRCCFGLGNYVSEQQMRREAMSTWSPSLIWTPVDVRPPPTGFDGDDFTVVVYGEVST